eukprot:COSAG02_NODE_5184_length_4560_cov_35.274602_8_plen_64_part_00
MQSCGTKPGRTHVLLLLLPCSVGVWQKALPGRGHGLSQLLVAGGVLHLNPSVELQNGDGIRTK